MTYEEKRDNLLRIKNSLSKHLFSIEEIHGIGLRVNENKIVVYVSDITPEVIKQIPLSVEGIDVELIGSGQMQPSATTNVYHGGEVTYVGGTRYQGTLGSFWYSHKQKLPVMISCNHVFANCDYIGGWDVTAPVPFSITSQSNGWIYNYNATDYPQDATDYRQNIKPTISSVTPNSGKKGDYFEIRGSNFGGALKGEVWINGVRQSIVMWGPNVIVVNIINSVPIGTWNLVVKVKGGLITSSKDLGSHKDTIGNIIEYPLLNTGTVNADGNDETQMNSDFCIAEAYLPNMSADIIQHGAVASTHPNYNFYATGRVKRITGICRNVRENLPLTMTGVSGGTEYVHVIDAHTTTRIDYGNGKTTFYDSVYYVWSTKDGTNPSFPPGEGGMSGSSLMVADIDELIAFYDTYNLQYPDRSLMEAAFKNAEGVQDVFVNEYVGQHFAASPATFEAVGDNSAPSIDYYRLEPLATVTQTYTDDIKTMNATSGISASAYIDQPDLIAYADISNKSFFMTYPIKEQILDDFNLESIDKITDLTKIEFSFGMYVLTASASINTTSIVDARNVNLIQKYLTAGAIFNINSNIDVNEIDLFELVLNEHVTSVKLEGTRILNTIFKGLGIKNIILKGDAGMTAENQDFKMTAGDAFEPVFPCTQMVYNPVNKTIEEKPIDFTGTTIVWVLKTRVDDSNNLIKKTLDSGIRVIDDTILIKLDKNDTLNLGQKKPYYHECEMTDDKGNPSTLFRGKAVIVKSGV